MLAAATNCTRLSARASSIPFWLATGPPHEHRLQGRDDPDARGLAPAANVEAAVRLIGEAKSAGAEYVQTPEMTNIMEVKRERLFATIVDEAADTSLATFRELARKLGITVHVGSLAIKVSPDRAANRSFLIDPKGD